MYLGSGITIGGKHYPLADVIHSNFYMTDRLVGFGYKTLTANRDNMFCQKGESIRCHEFHYSNCDFIGDAFAAEKRGKKLSDCMFSEENLIAGYPHLHFWSNLHFARNFVRRCYEYKRKRG